MPFLVLAKYNIHQPKQTALQNMNIVKISAFSDGEFGGNPAGVMLTDEMPAAAEMQKIAAEVGFSETAFAEMRGNKENWRIRYFSPESEVPFCGHATIALGAALAEQHGTGQYHLELNETEITVEGKSEGGQYVAALQSPRTHHTSLDNTQIADTLNLFGYQPTQLSNDFAPARIHGGADHYVLPLASLADLSAMNYKLDEGRALMNKHELVTIMLVVIEEKELFHARNAFASGGVLEDPATGAAAAALIGYLRDIGWTNTHKATIIQGEDMGCRSIINAEFSNEIGSSIRVSGTTRKIL